MQCSDLAAWLEAHKQYTEPVAITAIEKRLYRDSVSADGWVRPDGLSGPVSQECKPLLAAGGHLLANDGHYDAARAQMDNDYTLVAALNGEGAVEADDEELRAYFVSKQGQPLTHEMLTENQQRPPSRARYKMARTADAYLFRFK